MEFLFSLWLNSSYNEDVQHAINPGTTGDTMPLNKESQHANGLSDMEAFASNLAQLTDLSKEIWSLYNQTHHPDADPKTDPMNLGPALANFSSALARHPETLLNASMDYWSGQFALWSSATNKMLGIREDPGDIPPLPDEGRRFSHPDWSENALFEYVKRSYLLTSSWLQKLVEQNDDSLELMDRKKVEFATRNFLEAMNPANFYALNPEVMETTIAENGENLVRGAKMMLEDMKRGKGELLIRQTDMKGFKVGENMALTEGKVIWQNDILQLIQYAPTTQKVHETPLLVIPPWINKYYVLDLNPKKSMMKWLVDQGHTVFMISWVNPNERHKDQTWETYLFDGAVAALDRVLEETGTKQANLASYCIGGTLTGTLMAHLGKNNDKRVKSTTFFTAQLDFEDPGELQVFVDKQTVDLVKDQMEAGYLPAESMAQAFNLLRSNDLIWSYVVNNYMLGKDPFPFDLLYWNSDSTAMPGKVHYQYLQDCYLNNAFAKGDFTVKGKKLSLSEIKGPVYHIATVEDHIAPAASVYRGARQMSSADITFVLSGSGHIAGVVNPPALKKYQYWVNSDLSPQSLDEWKDAAEMHDGSWWPHWDKWLAGHSAKKVKARKPGATHGAIEDAPGSYVKVRFDQQDAG